MSGIAKALRRRWSAQKVSMTADEWPGVIVRGSDWRIGLDRSARRYVVQRRAARANKGWSRWLVPLDRPATIEALGRAFPGFPEAVALLPADPIDAAASMAAAQEVVAPSRRRAYWLADDYPGVVAQVGNIRVVRDRACTVYAVQRRPLRPSKWGDRGEWITQRQATSCAPLAEWLLAKAYQPGPDGPSVAEIPERVAALFDGVPEFAAEWPMAQPAAKAAAEVKGTGETGSVH